MDDIKPTPEQPHIEATPSLPPAAINDEALFDAVDRRITTDRSGPAPAEPPPNPEWYTTGPAGVALSAANGFNRALLEVHDSIFGEPEEQEKSWFRKSTERVTQQLRSSGGLNSATIEISQFATGLVGVGKALAPLKAAQQLGTLARGAFEIGRAAVAGAYFMDPHEDRLSNLIQEYEPLRNPVTAYLAASPDDSAAEGRFKNALEGIGLDLAVVGILLASTRAFKFLRQGNEAAGREALQELEELQAAPSSHAAPDSPTAPPGKATVADEAPPARPADSPEGAVAPKATPEAEGPPVTPPGQASSLPDGTVPPPQAYAPATKITEAEVQPIIATTRAEIAAIKQFGSREAALEAGEIAARPNLPWQKIGSSDDVEALIATTTRTIQAQMDAAKGGAVLSDARVQAMVKDSAELFGADPDTVMAEIVKSGERANHLVADMEASYIIARKLFEDAHSLSLKIKMGMLDEFGGSITQANTELVRRFVVASDMMAQGASMRAAFGRGLRRNRSQFAISAQDVEAFKTLPPERLADILAASGGDVKKLAQAAHPAFMRRVLDEVNFSLTNSLLWTWPTHAANLTSNFYMLAARPTEKLLGSLAMGPKGGLMRRQAIKEYGYTVTALADGWTAMLDAFRKGDSVLAPHTVEYFGATHAPLQWKPVHSVGDLIENGYKALNYRTLVGLPTRSLGAVDEFMKQLRYRAVVQAKAGVEAAERGLTGREAEELIASRLSAAFDDAGRAVDDAALREAQTATFQQDLLSGTAGKSLQDARSRHPAIGLILPFIKTPVNVLRYAWKMTPGINVLQREYRDMLKGTAGKEAQAHAIGQMVLGTTFMSLAGLLAANGRMTGGGPSDPALLANLKATGWQPYSLTWTDDEGTRHFFPLSRFDPIAMPMGLAADIVELQQAGNEQAAEEGAAGVALALAKAFEDRSFLQSLSSALRAASEPEANMERFLGQLAGNALPFSSLSRQVNPDPYMREARSFMDNILAKLPGASTTLPPRRDAFGEPMWTRIGLATTEDSDIVEAEHNRIMLETGYGLHSPSPVRGGVDLREVVLSDGRNAYDVFQEFVAEPPTGPGLKTSLARLIQSPGYADLVDGDPELRGTKLAAITDVVSKHRAAAYAILLRRYPEVRQLLSQEQLRVRGEVASKRSEGKAERPGVQDLLQSLGY